MLTLGERTEDDILKFWAKEPRSIWRRESNNRTKSNAGPMLRPSPCSEPIQDDYDYDYDYVDNQKQKIQDVQQMYKMCTKCFDTLPFKMFYNCLRNYDRKASWCKTMYN